NLFLAHAHVIVSLSQHGGLEEISWQSNIGALTAVAKGCTFIDANVDIRLDLFQLGLECQWTKLSLILERVADDDGRGSLSHAFYEFIVDAAVCEDAATCNASLAGSGEDTGDYTYRGVGDVGIVEDNVRALAAKLEGRADKTGRGLGSDRCAGCSRPSKGNLRELSAANQRGACFPTQTSNHVDYTCWETSLVGQFSKAD